MLDSTRSGVVKTIEIVIYFWNWHKKNLFWLKLCVHVCWCFACIYVCVCAHICVHVARDSHYGLTTISSICMVSNCDNKIDDDYYDYCNNIPVQLLTLLPYFTVVFVILPSGFIALCLISTCVTPCFNLIAL